MTPGGTCREVLVRQSFDYLIDNPECLFRDPARGKRTDMVPSMRSVPPELPDSMASKQQLADGAAPAGRKAASGQLTDADVAQAISDAGELAAHHLAKLASRTNLFLSPSLSPAPVRDILRAFSMPSLSHRSTGDERGLVCFAGLAKPESPSTSGAAANPFATIRAVVTPAVPASRHARPPLHDEVR